MTELHARLTTPSEDSLVVETTELFAVSIEEEAGRPGPVSATIVESEDADVSVPDYRRGEIEIWTGEPDDSELLTAGPIDRVSELGVDDAYRVESETQHARLDDRAPEAAWEVGGIVADEIRRVYAAFDFLDGSVIEPDITPISTDLVVADRSVSADEWTIPSETPMTIEDGEFSATPTCQVTEGQDINDLDTASNVQHDFGDLDEDLLDASSGGDAGVLDTPESVGGEDVLLAAVEFDHQIPAGALKCRLRGMMLESDSNIGGLFIRNADTGTASALQLIDEPDFLSWTGDDDTATLNTETSLAPGEYEIFYDPSLIAGAMYIDVVAVFDSRFEYTFDNDVHEDGGALDGPELLPSSLIDADVPLPVSEQFSADATVESATIQVTPGPLDGVGVQFSADRGIHTEQDTTATFEADLDRSEPIERDQAEATTTVQASIAVSRVLTGESAADTTPRFGRESTTRSSFTVEVDTIDLPFIRNRILTGSFLDVLQTLHDAGGLTFVVDPVADADSPQPIESFRAGAVSIDDALDVLRTEREWETQSFATELRAIGEDPPHPATVVTAADLDVDVDETVPAVETFSTGDLDTLRMSARESLRENLDSDRQRGSAVLLPQRIRPGHLINLATFDTELLIRQVRLDDGAGAAETVIEFSEPKTIADNLE